MLHPRLTTLGPKMYRACGPGYKNVPRQGYMPPVHEGMQNMTTDFESFFTGYQCQFGAVFSKYL